MDEKEEQDGRWIRREEIRRWRGKTRIRGMRKRRI